MIYLLGILFFLCLLSLGSILFMRNSDGTLNRRGIFFFWFFFLAAVASLYLIISS